MGSLWIPGDKAMGTPETSVLFPDVTHVKKRAESAIEGHAYDPYTWEMEEGG